MQPRLRDQDQKQQHRPGGAGDKEEIVTGSGVKVHRQIIPHWTSQRRETACPTSECAHPESGGRSAAGRLCLLALFPLRASATMGLIAVPAAREAECLLCNARTHRRPDPNPISPESPALL